MSLHATNALISRIFPKGSILCAMWATKDDDFTQGALCLTQRTTSFIKSGMFQDLILHYPLNSSMLSIENGLLSGTISIAFNGSVSNYKANRNEALNFIRMQQSLIFK